MSTERKRAYDRQRMARLYAQGETWWQKHPDRRSSYDFMDMRPFLDARPLTMHSWRKRPVPLEEEHVRALAKENVLAIFKQRLNAEFARIDES